MTIPEIKFGKLLYEEDEGQGTVCRSFAEVKEKDFCSYVSGILALGYKKHEELGIAGNTFVALSKGGDAVYCAYYPSLCEARIVTEPSSEYLNFSDSPRTKRVDPLFTQIDLGDFGESVTVRLADGRFIIFDGGREYDVEAENLIASLTEQSPDEKPTVAAWIITHPHNDHYGCFTTICEKHLAKINVERLIYNFTDLGEKDCERIRNLSDYVEGLKLFEECVRKCGAKVYKAHTGQVYSIGGACLEMLSTPDDTLISPVKDINALSLVIKLTVENQAIMMCADAFLPATKLAIRFGEYLKSDILQPSHHMFVGGDVEAYSLIDPTVCIVPSFEDDVYGRISPYQNICKKENLHLFYGLNVEEFYTGSTGNITLRLPYKPIESGKRLYLNKLEKYRKAMGAENWFFSDVGEDDEFMFLNTSIEVARVSADLFFDDINRIVRKVQISVPQLKTYRVRFSDPNTVDGGSLPGNRHSLNKKGIPKGEKFTVCFTSNIPILIKSNKPADYHS